MLSRRLLLSAAPAAVAALASPARAAPDDFADFVASVRADARRQGISSLTLDRAFSGVSPNQKVLDKLRHPPESTMTWADYRAMLVTPQRIAEGRAAYRRNAALFYAVQGRFGVPASVILGIWGLESSYGTKMGDYRVVESLSTLAWESSRRPFFRGELLDALKILDHGDVIPAHMTGSYAGAMGQPQFMPSSYLRFAVDFTGNGRRDIWTSTPDVLASIANYLARNGWRMGEGWGLEVVAPSGLDDTLVGRDQRRSLTEWARLGFRASNGRPIGGAQQAGLVMPDGPGGEAFLVFANFGAIRRYNPSDFYALVVGLIGDDVLT